MFLHYKKKVVNSDKVDWVDTQDIVTYGFITVHYKDGTFDRVLEPDAITVVMSLCPAVLEGEQAKYKRHAWAIHNLIGHPLMQIFSWLHLPSLGIKIHDATVPMPIE